MKEKVLMAIIVSMLLLQCGLIQKLLGDKLGFFCSNSFELVFSVNLYTGKGGGSSFYFQKGMMTLIKFLPLIQTLLMNSHIKSLFATIQCLNNKIYKDRSRDFRNFQNFVG